MGDVAELLKSLGPRAIAIVGVAYVSFGLFAYWQADPGSDLKMFLFEFRKSGAPPANKSLPEISLPPKTTQSSDIISNDPKQNECRALVTASAREEAEAILDDSLKNGSSTSACESYFNDHPSNDAKVLVARSLAIHGSSVRARALFEEAAEAGDTHSNLVLGYVYTVNGNPVQTLSHFFRAFAKGEPYAAYGLGIYLERGMSDLPNYLFAAAMYRAASESGVPEAQYHLGQLYRFGLGVPEDKEMSLKLLRQAAAKDFEPAVNYIKKYYNEN